MKKVLVVDDEAIIRRLVKSTLRSRRYEVFQAKNGRQAIEIARAERPDVVIMDVMMRGELDGLEVTRILKNDQDTSGIKILMLTGLTTESDLEKGMHAGADEYFTKPFSPLALRKKIEEMLGQ